MSPLPAGLKAELKKALKAARWEHTKGVARQAGLLAARHGVDPDRAELAGLLHDCGKALEREKMRPLLTRAGVDAQERLMPGLWHAPVGAYLARRHYGIRDGEILRAVRFHSTGAPRQTPLQRILFVADYTEPGRPWPEAKPLRALALKNLDQAYLEVLKLKLDDLIQRARPLHSRSVSAYHDALKSLR